MPFKFNSEFSKAREEMQSHRKSWADKPISSSIPKKAETGPKSLRSIAPKLSSAPSMTSKDMGLDKPKDKDKDKVNKKDTEAVPAQGPSGDTK